jgi:hypothetical protein
MLRCGWGGEPSPRFVQMQRRREKVVQSQTTANYCPALGDTVKTRFR